MTTFQRETDQPVIGFDMGGNVEDLWVCIKNNHFNYKTNLRRFHGWLNLSCCTLVAVSILWSSVHSYYCSKWWNQSFSVRFLHSMTFVMPCCMLMGAQKGNWVIWPIRGDPGAVSLGGEKRRDESFQVRAEESVPRGSFTGTWKLSSQLFSWPDWLPLGLRGWIWPCPCLRGPFSLHNVRVLLSRVSSWRSSLAWDKTLVLASSQE